MPGSNYNAPQYGVKYTLTRGAYRCTFNDPTDSDNIGSLTNIDGFDSPEVREQGENLQERDGGIHSDRFFYGRRPLTIEGVIHGYATVAARNDAIQKLMDVTNAMRDDMTITWQPAGGQEAFLNVRRQQPLRVEGLGPNKVFTAGMVSADPRIYSTTLHSQDITTPVSVSNGGSSGAFPFYSVSGPLTSGAIVGVNGANTITTALTLAVDKTLKIDTLKRIVTVGDRQALRTNWWRSPSFENTGITYTPDTIFNSSATSTTFALHGSRSLKVASVDNSANNLKTTLPYSSSSTHFPVDPVATPNISVSYWARGGSALGTTFLSVSFFTSGNSLISSGGPAGNAVTTSFVQTTYSVAVPSNAAYFTVQVGLTGATFPIGAAGYIDEMIVEPGTPGFTWFYPGVTSGAAWLGTTEDSISKLFAGADTHINPAQGYQYVALGNSSLWTPLAPGASTVGVYGTTGSTFNASMTWRDTWV